MLAYILRRLLLVIPTLLGIMVINFFIIQAAPGGPVEQMIAQHPGHRGRRHRALLGQRSGGETATPAPQATPGGERRLSRRARPAPELIERIEQACTASTSRSASASS